MKIGKITFTDREVDIISCILNARRAKKIAHILLISPRTVEAHIQNILTKIGANSQEAIIDFIEKSGQLKLIKEHYLNLLIIAIFEQQLKQIYYLIKKYKLSYSIICSEEELEISEVKLLLKHLKIAGITLIQKKYYSNTLIQTQENSNNCYNIYLLSEQNINFLLLENSCDGQKNIYLIKNTATQILLTKEKPGIHGQERFISFFIKEQYIQNVFQLLRVTAVEIELDKFINEFQRLKEDIISLKGENINGLLSNSKKVLHPGPSIYLGRSINFFRRTYYKNITLGFTFCLITVTALLLYIHYKPKNADITEINKELAEIIKNYSFENIGVTEGLKKNLNLLERLNNIVSNLDHQHMLNYLGSNKSSPEELLTYIYSLHIIGMNLLYNEYNHKKARNLLLIAKITIEKYIISKFKVKVDFNKLNPEEIYTELNIIEGLPSTYTKILYLLGRTYTYCDEDSRTYTYYNEDKRRILPITQAQLEGIEKYYNVAAYLGNKLKIFEGFLSVRSGTEMVRLLKIKNYIKQGEYERATQQIKNSIRLLEKLKQDRNQYILDYRPGNYEYKIIIPANDNFNKLFLTQQIVEHYARLIKMTKEKDQIAEYVGKISAYFIGGQNEMGIFDELEGIPLKRITYLYNSLGYVLLEFIEQDINFSKLKEEIEKKLNLELGNELKLVEQIFNLAKTKSRNTYYSKVDSYDGLVRVYEKMLEKNDIGSQKEQDFKKYIKELKEERDNLKEQLKVKSKSVL